MAGSNTSRPLSVYAPASVGNIGPGFDTLGMAITGMGDLISAQLDVSIDKDRIESITGAWTALPTSTDQNTASISARILLDRAGIKTPFRMTINKGVPGSGLGSSAASAVGGAFLGHLLSGETFRDTDILDAALAAEAEVSGGIFLDNISACLFGGVTVSHGASRTALPVGHIEGVHLIFIVPKTTVKTSEARRILPNMVPRTDAVGAISNTAGILASVMRRDPELFCMRVSDPLIEPYRKNLIQGFDSLKETALSSGATGFAISGAGSTMVALTPDKERTKAIKNSLQDVLNTMRIEATIFFSTIDPKGVRVANS